MLTDPWSIPGRTPTGARPIVRWSLSAIAWAGGIAATVAVVLDRWPGHRRETAALLVVSLAWELVLTSDPGRRRTGVAVAGVAAAAGLAALAPVIGDGTALVALGSVGVAHAVLVGWRPAPSWPERQPTIAALALAPLLAAEIRWYREVDLAGTLVLLVAALAIVESYHRLPVWMTRIDDGVRRAITALSEVLGTIVLLVIALPTLYLPGLATRILHRLAGAGSPGSTWRPRAIDLAEVRRDGTRPFATTPAPERRRRHAWGAVGLATTIAVAVIAGVALTGEDPLPPPAPDAPLADIRWRDAPYSTLGSFVGVPWADALQAEERAAGQDATGRYVNVDGGIRHTLSAPGCDCVPMELWILGGSAVWGVGQRDEYTIASELVRQGEARGYSIDVHNLGGRGLTIVQELALLRKHLDDTGRVPDLVIFYDGFNDIIDGVIHTSISGVDDTPNILDVDESTEYNATLPSLEPFGGAAAVGRLAADKYRVQYEAAVALTDSLDIPTVFVFQADAFTSRRQADGFTEQQGITTDALLVSDMAHALAAGADALSDVALDWRTILDDLPPVFLSVVHHNEVGSAYVAGALLDLVTPQLEAIAAGR